jgi:hypothetical protein
VLRRIGARLTANIRSERGTVSARYFATMRSLTAQTSATRISDHSDHSSSRSNVITALRARAMR